MPVINRFVDNNLVLSEEPDIARIRTVCSIADNIKPGQQEQITMD
jgi:hypothetical protein